MTPIKKFIILFIVFSGSLLGFNLPEGIEYQHISLKDKSSIHLLKINPEFFDLIVAKPETNALETVEKIANTEGVVAAINSGFFHTSGQFFGSPAGILKIEGEWHGLPNKPRGAIGWSNEANIVFFDQLLTELIDQKEIKIVPQSDDQMLCDWNLVTYIVGGTPLLIRNGKMIKDFSSEKTLKNFLFKKHARTAIGILATGHFIFVVVDGSNNFFFRNSGLTIPELADFMQSIGCLQALNLDGGGSSTMILQGLTVNIPCGEERNARGNYVRKVSDAILVLPKRK